LLVAVAVVEHTLAVAAELEAVDSLVAVMPLIMGEVPQLLVLLTLVVAAVVVPMVLEHKQ
tara:strand:+ start:573 stop:752 length:180 start_codon:yes stop_codon:yes gene_type:complete